MATGIKIYNTANTIQIDETYKNLVLAEKRNVAIEYLNPDFDVVIGGQYAVIAYYCNVGRPYLKSSYFDGTNWTYRFGSLWPTSHLGGDTDTMELYVFNVPTSPPTNFGLKVFNPAGELTFQSSEKPMKFAHVGTNDIGFTGTPGRKYAVCILQHSYNVVFTGSAYIHMYYFPVPFGDFIVSEYRDISFVFPFFGTNMVGMYAAVDVTNY